FSNSGLLIWSTYFGGGNYEVGNSLKCDIAGNIYITGMTFSTNFPVMFLAGAYNDATYAGGVLGDVFVARFSNSGTLTWATYFGGTGKDCGEGIAFDGSNNIYVTGFTESANFPMQNLPGAYNDNTLGGTRDIFILKFSSSCALNWSTYYGGTGSDGNSWMSSIVCDGSNNVYIVSDSNGGFPTQTLAGGYNDNVFEGGFSLDAVILKFNNSGACVWATYYGGAGDELGTSIRCDLSGNLYVEGTTNSTSVSFLTVPWGSAYYQSALGGGSDIFILRFTNAGVLTWATYYGGSLNERIQTADNIEIDDCGNVYVSFETLSTNIFTAGNAGCVQSYYDPSFNGGSFGGDLFIIKFNNVGSVLWATYFGGSGNDVREALALDNGGNLFITGEWIGVIATENSYPIINPGSGAYYDNTANGVDDGYIAKFIPVVPGKTQSQVNSSACGPCNGSATITLTCSEADFNYTWSNGSSTLNSSNSSNTITGLCVGSYTVTVTSNCNQSQTATFNITGAPCLPCNLTGQYTKGTAACAGCGCKEWILINATGGAGPYSYSWPDGYVSRYKNQLCPGTYTINIKDKNGCSVNVNLSAP
ncbi:MAG: SBBP repeat-containing protein, partial [Bacteroidia bacterium]|nr:SBBP repeat-containing protein [Bacteroidia bacterium]